MLSREWHDVALAPCYPWKNMDLEICPPTARTPCFSQMPLICILFTFHAIAKFTKNTERLRNSKDPRADVRNKIAPRWAENREGNLLCDEWHVNVHRCEPYESTASS